LDAAKNRGCGVVGSSAKKNYFEITTVPEYVFYYLRQVLLIMNQMYLYQMQVNLLPGCPKLSSSSTVPGLHHTENSSVSSSTKPQGVQTALATLL